MLAAANVGRLRVASLRLTGLHTWVHSRTPCASPDLLGLMDCPRSSCGPWTTCANNCSNSERPEDSQFRAFARLRSGASQKSVSKVLSKGRAEFPDLEKEYVLRVVSYDSWRACPNQGRKAGLRSTCPGCAPVGLPLSMTQLPPTMTAGMPSGGASGASMVDWSITTAGSKSTRSAI